MKMLDKATMDKLREHSKAHKGGMRGKHMKDMVKFMKEGDSFRKAHNKANAGKPRRPQNENGLPFDTVKEGALRRALKLKKEETFFLPDLRKINKTDIGKSFKFKGNTFKMTPLMKKRVTLAINMIKRD
jgi:hypothetical protein